MTAAAVRLIPANEINDDGRREHRRSRVMLSAVMMTGAAEVPVVIRDISACGALVATPVVPPVGSYVTLRRNVVCVVAQVVRREGNRIGLHFREMIDEASLLVVIGRPITASAH